MRSTSSTRRAGDSPRVALAEARTTPDPSPPPAPSPPLRCAKRGEGEEADTTNKGLLLELICLTERSAGGATLLPASACERWGGSTVAAKRRRAGWGD